MSTGLQHRVVRHGLFWLGVLALSFLIQLPAHWAVGTPLYAWGLLFNQLPASLLTTYPLLYWILPRLLRWHQPFLFLLLLAGWGAGCALLSILTRMFFDLIVQPGLFQTLAAPPAHPAGYWTLNYTFFMALVTAGGAAAIKMVNGWYEQRQLSQQLEQQRLHTELQLLKAQLQPKFLFDTLRTLQQLTEQKSPSSPGAVLALAGLLRYLLYDSARAAVPLAEEVAMLRHYVALERLRLGRRVEVSVSVSGPLEGLTIAPLLLLPFVENAFRHGADGRVDYPWVSLDLVIRPELVVFKVINSHAPPAADWPPEPGLTSIRQRLARLYPGRHELKLLADADTLLVVLRLPLTPAPPTLPAAARPAAIQYASSLT